MPSPASAARSLLSATLALVTILSVFPLPGAAQETYDVVLMDLELSDSQGLETLKRMRSILSEIPVVVFTSLEDEELAVRAVEMGAQDYLTRSDLRGGFLGLSL